MQKQNIISLDTLPVNKLFCEASLSEEDYWRIIEHGSQMEALASEDQYFALDAITQSLFSRLVNEYFIQQVMTSIDVVELQERFPTILLHVVGRVFEQGKAFTYKLIERVTNKSLMPDDIDFIRECSVDKALAFSGKLNYLGLYGFVDNYDSDKERYLDLFRERFVVSKTTANAVIGFNGNWTSPQGVKITAGMCEHSAIDLQAKIGKRLLQELLCRVFVSDSAAENGMDARIELQEPCYNSITLNMIIEYLIFSINAGRQKNLIIEPIGMMFRGGVLSGFNFYINTTRISKGKVLH